MPERRQWTINGRFLSQPVTGVQRYAREILAALDALVTQDHFLVRDLDLHLLAPPGVDLPELHGIRPQIVGPLKGHAWEQVVLPIYARGGIISLCNTGALSIRKQIVCMHDLNTRVYPSSYSRSFRLLYRLLLPTLGRHSETVATVSTYSAHELVKYGICPADRIQIIPNGHEHALRWRAQHSDKTNAASGRNTIVIVGSRAPHKNIGLITGLADKLKAAGLRLAVAGLGEQQVFATDSMSRVASDNVTWLGRLSDDELADLLRNALCLAFPSFVEGFGLPALEAMALGCPVVVSDRASLPEICADAALYASPDDGSQWLAHFIRLQNDEELRAALIKRGSERARLFSWNQSAEKYLLAMAAADGVFNEVSDRMQSQHATAVDAARSQTPRQFHD